MPTPALLLEVGTPTLYRVGRTGFDSGSADAGGVFTATMRTWGGSPTGDFGRAHFRRVGIRILHSAEFTCTVRIYVDGEQTQIWESGSLVAQEVVFNLTTLFDPPGEELLEVDLDAVGSIIEVELEVDSDEVEGIFLPESIEVHFRPLRKARESTPAQVS